MAADGDMPAALRERPALKRYLLPIWNAFHDLAGDRHIGMGIGPIPFSAIDRYATRFGITGRDEFQRFHALISAMDVTHQKHLAAKLKEPTGG